VVLYTEAKDPTQSDLHSLAFIFSDTTVTRTCAPSDQVQGAIRDRYVSLAGPCGFLGAPLTGELATPVKFGPFNHFQSGSIYWSPATGAREVRGAIRDTWSRQGWEDGALGFPTSDEYAVPGGRRSDFQGGSITWTPAGGTVVSAR